MEKLMGIEEVCGVLGISIMTFYRIRRDHSFPEPAVKISRKLIRWTEPQIEGWIQLQKNKMPSIA